MNIGPFIKKGDLLQKIPDGQKKEDQLNDNIINVEKLKSESDFFEGDGDDQYIYIRNTNEKLKIENQITKSVNHTINSENSNGVKLNNNKNNISSSKKIQPLTNPMHIYLKFNKNEEIHFE